jgi:hypothetical protein
MPDEAIASVLARMQVLAESGCLEAVSEIAASRHSSCEKLTSAAFNCLSRQLNAWMPFNIPASFPIDILLVVPASVMRSLDAVTVCAVEHWQTQPAEWLEAFADVLERSAMSCVLLIPSQRREGVLVNLLLDIWRAWGTEGAPNYGVLAVYVPH